MRNKVRLKKSQIDYFRKLARNSPNEILAYLVGEIVNPNLVVIDSFEYTKQYAFSTPDTVSWYTADLAAVQIEATKRGKQIVGYMHSHPEWDAVMSVQDYDHTIVYGFRLCGICSTQGRNTRPRFWVMDSALPCEIEYAKSKKE